MASSSSGWPCISTSARKRGQLIAHGAELRQLGVVLYERDASVTVAGNVPALLGRIRGVDARGDRAGGDRPNVGNEPFGAVVAEDDDVLARLDAERDQRASGQTNLLAVLAPGRRLPSSVALATRALDCRARARAVRSSASMIRVGMFGARWDESAGMLVPAQHCATPPVSFRPCSVLFRAARSRCFAATTLSAQVAPRQAASPIPPDPLHQAGRNVTVSLLTMGNGDQVWELFGHTRSGCTTTSLGATPSSTGACSTAISRTSFRTFSRA